jgi:hypothetical protein
MNNFGRKIKITVGKLQFNNDDLEIRFEVPFDDDAKPNQTKVEIYNLSNSTLSHIKKGDQMSVQAGYGTDIGVLASGKLSSILTKNEGVDKISTLYLLEGDDFSRVKITPKTADPAEKYKTGKNKGKSKSQVMKIAFKANADGKTIINRLVSILGIKLAGEVKLVRNKVYKSGYTVTELILNNLEEVVHDCGSVMYHRRGKLVIRPLKEGTDEKFLLEEDTGLIQSPDPFEEDGIKGYKFKCLLQHRITTASIIKINSKTANGQYRCRKGVHIADENDFYTEGEVI